MPTVVVGTAGHIDHGKTTLLRALTGIDADRLPEERERGMTIDVGYAHLAFDDGTEIDFVDVPGHDRLIGNMLVGAGEVDAAMLVVAADDGPRPQTLEHLALLDALGIAFGLAAVTKIDLVDQRRAASVAAEIEALLARTSLAGVRVLPVSAATGAGTGELRSALRELRDAVATRWAAAGRDPRGLAGGPLRLAVDRAFEVRGRGAVVTGSLRGGRIENGAELRREPGGDRLRVRGLQVHGSDRGSHDGGRTALNVVGLSPNELRRGDVLTAGPGIVASDRLVVTVDRSALAGPGGSGEAGAAERTGRRRGVPLRLHIGTDQVDGTLTGLPGTVAATLRLDRPVATFVGDRGVLREPASGRVSGGATVLDPAVPRGPSRRRLDPARLAALATAVDALRAGAGGARPAVDLARLDLHGAMPESGDGRLALADDVTAALESAALGAVADHAREMPLSPGLPLPRARAALLRRLRSLVTVDRRDATAATTAVSAVIDALVGAGRIARQGTVLRDPAAGDALPAELLAAMHRLEAALDVPAPPGLEAAARAAGCPADGVRALLADGRIVRLADDLAWSASTYHRLAAEALQQARAGPLTPAAFRDVTGTSRRYVLAILEDLDRRGILARTDAGHVPGPRAPRPADVA